MCRACLDYNNIYLLLEKKLNGLLKVIGIQKRYRKNIDGQKRSISLPNCYLHKCTIKEKKYSYLFKINNPTGAPIIDAFTV